MKLRNILLLAGAMTLTLTACGGGSMSKEEMQEASEGQMNLSAIKQAYAENPIHAEETYLGNIYDLTGIVTSIQADHVELNALYSPIENHAPSGPSDFITVDVYLSEEERKELSTNEVIHVVGVLSTVGGESGYTMEEAYYVDNVIEFTGEIQNFVLSAGGSSHLMEIESSLKTSAGLNYCLYTYPVGPATSFENIEEATIDGVTVKEGDTVTVQGTATYDRMTQTSAGTLYVYTLHFDLNQITSITKG